MSAIYPPLEFRGVIDRECKRADRFHNRFSLAIFEVGTPDENSVLIRRLVRTIHNRFRRTDEVGWYSRQQIGVILPFTPEEGAWKLAEYVSQVIASVTSPPAFTIYSYPSRNWPRKRFSRRYLAALSLGAFLNRRFNSQSRKSDEFHVLIARERARADRIGHTFSLLVFRLTELGNNRPAIRRLVSVLNRRLRDTDEMGWYDDAHLGAILPYVDREAAARIADSITKAVFGETRKMYSLYTYPESWFPDSAPISAEGMFPADEKRAAMLRQKLPVTLSAVDEDAEPADVDKTAEGHFLYRSVPAWKRTLDMIGAGIGLVLLSPVLGITALLIRIVSPEGPVFFRQERLGFMQEPFTLLKFRTMKVNNDTAGHTQYMRKLIVEDSESKPMTKQDNKAALIPFGGFIRSSCIDELPQLLNVFKGEMSLVGPRPCLAYEAEEYLRWHARRFDSLPGMTGLWQVSGKNRTTFKEMIRLDIQYERKRSLALDLKILLLTPIAIVRQVCDKARGCDAPPADKTE